VKLYGTMKTWSCRCIWALRELLLHSEIIPVDLTQGQLTDSELLALNANGRVPVLEDENGTFWESMAINIYLSKKAGGPLAPQNLVEDALIIQWSIWAVNEIERPLFIIAANLSIFPEEADPEEIAHADRRLDRPLTALEASPKDDYLIANRFTIADLNVASVLAGARMANFSLARWPVADAYLNRCPSRPHAFDPHEVLSRHPRPPQWVTRVPD
jgi:glutathione S-transferase